MAKDNARSGGRTGSAMGSAQGSQRDDMSSMKDGQFFPMAPEQWREKIREFTNLNTVKFIKIFQALFYFLQYRTREACCERDTNKIDWKKAKANINDDMFTKMGDYWPIGAKENNYREYEKMKYVQKCLEGVNSDELDEYSVALGKLYKWLNAAIEVRTEDIRMRKMNKESLKEKREKAIQDEKARMELRAVKHEEAKLQYDEQ